MKNDSANNTMQGTFKRLIREKVEHLVKNALEEGTQIEQVLQSELSSQRAQILLRQEKRIERAKEKTAKRLVEDDINQKEELKKQEEILKSGEEIRKVNKVVTDFFYNLEKVKAQMDLSNRNVVKLYETIVNRFIDISSKPSNATVRGVMKLIKGDASVLTFRGKQDQNVEFVNSIIDAFGKVITQTGKMGLNYRKVFNMLNGVIIENYPYRNKTYFDKFKRILQFFRLYKGVKMVLEKLGGANRLRFAGEGNIVKEMNLDLDKLVRNIEGIRVISVDHYNNVIDEIASTFKREEVNQEAEVVGSNKKEMNAAGEHKKITVLDDSKNEHELLDNIFVQISDVSKMSNVLNEVIKSPTEERYNLLCHTMSEVVFGGDISTVHANSEEYRVIFDIMKECINSAKEDLDKIISVPGAKFKDAGVLSIINDAVAKKIGEVVKNSIENSPRNEKDIKFSDKVLAKVIKDNRIFSVTTVLQEMILEKEKSVKLWK